MSIAGHWLVGCLVALALIASPTKAARAQDTQAGACFNIIVGNADKPEAGAFLLNRCSGQSWRLRMTIKVAINGYGRIGRNILRGHYEGGKKHDLAIVAINDLGSPETNAHLTRYDTTHGKFPGKVSVEGDSMVVDGDRIKAVGYGDAKPVAPNTTAEGRQKNRRIEANEL